MFHAQFDETIGGTSLSIFNPLEALFGEYDAKKARIDELHSCLNSHSEAISYFLDGARVESSDKSCSIAHAFDYEPAIRSLGSEYWKRAMALTDCLELMPTKRKLAWEKLIRERVVAQKDERGNVVVDENNHAVFEKLPAFDRETVVPTLSEMLASRQKFLGERVSGLFDRLSGTHVTNSPSGFNQRMIMTGGFDINNQIHDLRCVIAKFMGRDEPYSRATDYSFGALNRSNRFGEWHIFDAGALRIKFFKNENIHMEVNPDIAFRLNQVLAWLYPLAIPSEFRTKPVRKHKEFFLKENALAFSVLNELELMRQSYGTKKDRSGLTLWSDRSTVSSEAKDVLTFIGGVQTKANCWSFDYQVMPVLEEVIRTGMIPEQKSHQFWETQDSLGSELIEIAEIEGCTSFLEPSAGQAGLAKFLPPEHTVCVEISNLHCKILESKGFNVHCADFLQWSIAKKFERIIMNPPFSNGRAKDHVKHAARMLEVNGRLVAILPSSLRNTTLMEGMKHTWSKVYSNEFKGTGASVAILVLEKFDERN